MKKRLTLGLIALGALVLTGCGLRGDLDRPPPMWLGGSSMKRMTFLLLRRRCKGLSVILNNVRMNFINP